jgi:DegV family protein with EDD domain
MGKIGLVTDSTCDLGPEWLGEHDVRMVPLKVIIGDHAYLDWIDFTPEAFYPMLVKSAKLPTTSQPSPADFAKVYAELADQGCEEIVSIHLSAKLSGTCESALLAAVDSPVRVRVVDSLVVSHATGLVVKAAITARDAGGDAAAVEGAALTAVGGMHLYFLLDTLDYLVKGGRAGAAAGLAASLLNIKPILQFNNGVIEPFKKVKGRSRAITEAALHAAKQSDDLGKLRVTILHANIPDLVQEVITALDESGCEYELDHVGLIGSVIGTHCGPGALGLAYYPIG